MPSALQEAPKLDRLAARFQSAEAAQRDDAFADLLQALHKDLRAVAGKAARAIGRPDAMDDLFQSACLALLDCAARYDPAKGSFGHYALASARAAVQDQQRLEGRHLVLPDEEPLRLARLARSSLQAYQAQHGQTPSRAQWREAMRLQALAEAHQRGADEAAAAAQVRRLNLNQVDPRRAMDEAAMGTVWLDQPVQGRDGAVKEGRHDRYLRALPSALEEGPTPEPPVGALLELLAREAVRDVRRQREARRRGGRQRALSELASELRKEEAVLALLTRRSSLHEAAAELGSTLVTLRKWLGEAQAAIRQIKDDPARLQALKAAALEQARVQDIRAFASAGAESTPAARQLALLYTLAASPSGGAPAGRLYEDLASHYGGKGEEARERQLKRDVEDLRAQGWPVISLYRGGDEPWYLLARPKASLDAAFTLSGEEARALAQALAAGAGDQLPPEPRQALSRLLALRSEMEAPAHKPAVRGAWAVLLNGIESARAVDLSLKGDPKRRSFSPYAWFQHGSRTFVVAREHAGTAGPLRALDLNEVKEARDTADAFQAPDPGFDAQRWVFEQRPWYAAAPSAAVRLQGPDAEWARQRWPFVRRRPAPEGAWDFDFYVEDADEFLDFLLREFGSKALLLPGKDGGLRRRLAARLKRAA